MQIINVTQGSQAWLDLRATKFTASEAPAMMGASKYQSRDALLKMKATGETPEVSSYQEKIFAKGHATEEAARPLVENIIGDELFPATAISDEYDWMLASFDGITMMEDVVFEHKLFNQGLYERVLANDLEPHYYWQLEQQLLVSGAEKNIFVCSDGTSDRFASCEYYSQPERRDQLVAGWQQFKKDLASYSDKPEVVKVEAEPIRDLPVISYKMDGLALNSNLDVFKQAAAELVAKSNQPIETDQDFADAEQMVKTFKGAEDKIKALSEQVLGEVQSIDSFVKDLKYIGEQIRQARLTTDKQVKNRKDEIRRQILTAANNKILQHALLLEQQIQANLPHIATSVLDAMKGKKTVQSLQEAADTAVSQIMVELDLHANKAKTNLAELNNHADHQFLFNDWSAICFKETDDFEALVTSRIAKHKEAEQQRLEQERLRIQREEKAKAERELEAERQRILKEEREAKAKANRELEVERQRIRNEERAAAQAEIKPQPQAVVLQQAVADTPAPQQSTAIQSALQKGQAALEPISVLTIVAAEIKASPMVQMTANEANYLRKRDAVLSALEAAGVDNWSGYDDAVAALTQQTA
ncbi:lambda-exonuclease family protein [Photobacterium carnosum]|uniref:lambda-exonuclease family protein n=1 Tax=Photobacterium carnosum TaxID=2023717 RepID=UPI001E3B034E|nr:YqaJ viral recombinase family protein [Photobacterium carnosum]